MSWFKREKQPATELPPSWEPAPPPEAPPMSAPIQPGYSTRAQSSAPQQCLEATCGRQDATPCNYMDRRGRLCDTAWCPDHIRSVGGQMYCRRHAGVMNALAHSPLKGHLPDIDNRAPSLANWVGNDLDVGTRQILGEMCRESEGETVIVEPVGYVYTVRDRAHQWERAWKLASHTGIIVKVAIAVDESNDSLVQLRINHRIVLNTVPPWVEHHRLRQQPDAATDARERREFYNNLLTMIRKEAGDERRNALNIPYIGSEGVQTSDA